MSDSLPSNPPDSPKESWLKRAISRVSQRWIEYLALSLVAGLLARFGIPFNPPDQPDTPIWTGAQGWVDDQEAVKKAVKEIAEFQGFPAEFEQVFQAGADDDAPVFFWEAENKILGKTIDSWNQLDVGSCVSFGWGRGVQDLVLVQIASGKNEEWPGFEIATEPIYGGSRVEVGGGRITGDGSVGAWAGTFVQKWGFNLRKRYQSADLSVYSTATCRDFGRRGVPQDIEDDAKLHPVRGVAMVTTGDQVWQAIGNGYPVPICSNLGFNSPLREGFCEENGRWAHCMLVRGRFEHPTRGRCFVIQNSWGDYLRASESNRMVEVKGRGKIKLPQGCFATTFSVMDRIAKQRDSFAISDVKGFPSRKINWEF